MKPTFWNDEEWERMRQKAAQHRRDEGGRTERPQGLAQGGKAAPLKGSLRSGMVFGLLVLVAGAVVERDQPDRAAFLIFGALMFGLCASMYAVVDHRTRGRADQ